MRLFRDAGWILLGVLLGTAASLVIAHRPVEFATVDAVSLASVTVFALLIRSLQGP